MLKGTENMFLLTAEFSFTGIRIRLSTDSLLLFKSTLKWLLPFVFAFISIIRSHVVLPLCEFSNPREILLQGCFAASSNFFGLDLLLLLSSSLLRTLALSAIRVLLCGATQVLPPSGC